MKVAFAGLGAMGRNMAKRLIRAGHTLSGYDPAPETSDWLIDCGAKSAGSVAGACRQAEALVVMVLDGEQLEDVLFGPGGAVEALTDGALVLSGVTVHPETAVRIGDRANAMGWHFLDCPVSGGVHGAQTGALTMMASGTDAAWNLAQPLLKVMGKNVYRLGDRPGPGSTMKMVHQLAAAANLAVVAEVMSFGAHLGLEPQQILEVIRVSVGDSRMLQTRAPRMIEESNEVVSALDLFVKDLAIVLDAAKSARFPAPVGATALQVLLGALGTAEGRVDDTQIVRFYESLGARPIRRGCL